MQPLFRELGSWMCYPWCVQGSSGTYYRLLSNSAVNYAAIIRDLEKVVNLLGEQEISSALQGFYDKWKVSEPAWVAAFKGNLGDLKFHRGLLPPGWPIVGNLH